MLRCDSSYYDETLSRRNKRRNGDHQTALITSESRSTHRERIGQPVTPAWIHNRSPLSLGTTRPTRRNKTHLQNYWSVDSHITHGQGKVSALTSDTATARHPAPSIRSVFPSRPVVSAG